MMRTKKGLLLLDVSESMTNEAPSLAVAVTQLAQSMPDVLFTIVLFNTDARVIREDVSCPVISRNDMTTFGGTALYDTILQFVPQMPSNSTIVLVTDGADTVSQAGSRERAREMIKKAKEERGISFIFLAQGEDAFETGKLIGMNEVADTFQTPAGKNIADVINSEQFSSACAMSLGSQYSVDVDEAHKRALGKSDRAVAEAAPAAPADGSEAMRKKLKFSIE